MKRLFLLFLTISGCQEPSSLGELISERNGLRATISFYEKSLPPTAVLNPKPPPDRDPRLSQENYDYGQKMLPELRQRLAEVEQMVSQELAKTGS